MPLVRAPLPKTEGEGSHAADGDPGGVAACVVGAAASPAAHHALSA